MVLFYNIYIYNKYNIFGFGLFQLNTLCESGLTPLMLAVLSNDEATVRCLLEFGCDPDVETPPQGAAVSNGSQ